MSNRIEKKVLPAYFEAIVDGRKKFELRIADFDCEVGDILVLREWDREKQTYTGRSIEKTITYIARTKDVDFFPAEDVEKYGYQVLSFH